MKVTVTIGGKRYKAKLPYPHAKYVVVDVACPECANNPLEAQGVGNQERGHDTIKSNCACTTCNKVIGTICVQVDTIFGLAEDDKVLNGRWRVY